MAKLFVHRKVPGGKVHTADYWSDRAACGASLIWQFSTSEAVTCKRCQKITYD